MVEWLQGKKTYITALAAAVVAALQALGISVPEWVYILLASFGLGFLRNAIGSQNK